MYVHTRHTNTDARTKKTSGCRQRHKKKENLIFLVSVSASLHLIMYTSFLYSLHLQCTMARGGGGTPYIQMIGMSIVFFRGCNWRFGIF